MAKQDDLYISPKGAILFFLFAAYQDDNEVGKRCIEHGLNVAEQRGFAQRDIMVRYGRDPKSEPNGKQAVEAFMALLPAEEFLTLNGFKIVKNGELLA